MTEEMKAAKREYMRNWRKEHREEIRAYHREWCKTNPDKVIGYANKYWSRKATEMADNEPCFKM